MKVYKLYFYINFYPKKCTHQSENIVNTFEYYYTVWIQRQWNEKDGRIKKLPVKFLLFFSENLACAEYASFIVLKLSGEFAASHDVMMTQS